MSSISAVSSRRWARSGQTSAVRLWRKAEYTRSVVVLLTVLVLVWDVSVRVLGIRSFILPAPTVVFTDLADNPWFFWRQSLYTFYVTAAGFLIALVGGVCAAIAIVSSRLIERSLYTFLVTTNSIPKVALAPLFVIWLGTGAAPKVAIAAIIAVFPIVINTTTWLRAVDGDMLDLARSARASKRDIMLKIRLPNALPNVFAGAKIGISFALIGAIVGEFVAGEQGLGYVILTSQATFNSTRAFAAIVVLGLLGTLLFFAVEAFERRALPWHVSQRTREER